jgi:DeoR/GlpR family transcriptional regulator of sugar metabolism
VHKRNTQQRRRTIVELVNEQQEVSVDYLASYFATSEVTIRKDLTELENNGLLLRRFGGAVPVPQEFIHQQAPENISKRKVSLGKVAAELINDHNRIIIDSGTTTSSLIPELSQKQGLVVMTNSLNVANALRDLENEPTILMTGGTWDPTSESFQGKLAEQVLHAYNFDQLFIGADGLDLERGTTTYNELFSLSQVMAEVSREVIVMMESEKFQRRIHNLELPWKNIDILVTDSDVSAATVAQIEQHDVKVICAK